MSEYQFVHFLAIDRPLDDEQLEFVHKQSSRAKISRWEFTNEYHYGDFRGDAVKLLLWGYDVHLHYANFGIRKLMFRLPARPPCEQSMFEAFLVEDGVEWVADKKGKGGILSIEPEADAGTFDEELFDVATMLPEIAPLRETLLAGDLRPLYLAWLACSFDEELLEPPVPAGLDKLTPALQSLVGFYELSDDLIAAAAEGCPSMPKASDAGEGLDPWLARRTRDELQELVQQLLEKGAAASRAEILARIRDETDTPTWPTTEPTRTLPQLRELATELGEQRRSKEQKAREAARRKRLAAMAANPDKTIANVQKLVKERSTHSYDQAARELAELREALGPECGPTQTREIVEKLRGEKPRRIHLIGALRKHGLLD